MLCVERKGGSEMSKKKVLVIGGTRNVGHFLTHQLLDEGFDVTVFNRGKTPDELPDDIVRIHGDRSCPQDLERALEGRSFDAVVDMALYNGREAEAAINLFTNRTERYIFISTGQVYLIRQDLQKPYKEDDYPGPVMEAPATDSHEYGEWLYGFEKRQAEDLFMQAWEEHRFPYTTLRLPMVNSERDHFHRIYGYLLRMQDDYPILLPDGRREPVRHVYAGDVAKAICLCLKTGKGIGQVCNISQDETLSLEAFLALLADTAGYPLNTLTINKEQLTFRQLLPECSPFSADMMSELDNTRSKAVLGMTYTPLATYLRNIVTYYEQHPLPTNPSGYQRRQEELDLASQVVRNDRE